MKLLLGVVCSSLLFATQAAPEDWLIIPSTCVIHTSGDICRLEISIRRAKPNQNIPANTCITLDEERLHCTQATQQEIRLPITLSHTSSLLITSSGGEIFSKTLFVQTIKPIKKRRRVRNPWSLF